MGLFKEKGVILRSHLSENIKVVLGIYEAKGKPDVPLAKCYCLRMRPIAQRLAHMNLYKTWLNLREIYALIAALQRVAILMEEYYDGTLDLKDILTEDEEIRGQIRTENTMNVTVENMFKMSNGEEEKE